MNVYITTLKEYLERLEKEPKITDNYKTEGKIKLDAKNVNLQGTLLHEIYSYVKTCRMTLNKPTQNICRQEIESWCSSLLEMANLLKEAQLPEDIGIAIEFPIAFTGNRIDFMVSGFDKKDNPQVIIFELKGWQIIKASNNNSGMVYTNVINKDNCVMHPSRQVAAYKRKLYSLYDSIQTEKVKVSACAYLYNYKPKEIDFKVLTDDKEEKERINKLMFQNRNENDSLKCLHYKKYQAIAKAFTKNDRRELEAFIKERIVKASDGKRNAIDILDSLAKQKLRNSDKLVDKLEKFLTGIEELNLSSEQRDAVNVINTCITRDERNVIIVEGGPGTGKTAIAIYLLSKLIQNNPECKVRYLTKNKAPRDYYKEIIEDSILELENGDELDLSVFFEYPANVFCKNAKSFTPDIVLVDEAHRLAREYDGNDNNQLDIIKELNQNIKHCIYFIDPNQLIAVYDYGTIENIYIRTDKGVTLYLPDKNVLPKIDIKDNNLDSPTIKEVKELKLTSQYRIKGSNYEEFLEVILYGTLKEKNTTVKNYDLRLFDSPTILLDKIKELNKPKDSQTARLVAGYCWQWSKDNPAKKDIEISDKMPLDKKFTISWNLKDEVYALAKDSVKRAGCIHTVQGLEFDYIGVIIGKDLVYNNNSNQLEVHYEKHDNIDDHAINSRVLRDYCKNKEKINEKAKQLILNTYYVLLTRGRKGCFIYCCDKGLHDYISRNNSVKVISSGKIKAIKKDIVSNNIERNFIEVENGETLFISKKNLHSYSDILVPGNKIVFTVLPRTKKEFCDQAIDINRPKEENN